jgi:transposase
MMGKQSGQIEMAIIDMEQMIPQNHLLRKINQIVDFSFIYEQAASLYAKNGRPSIDPVLLIKMLLVGYIYGIKSERRLEQEVQLNIAYRWFCGLQLTERVPDHSTFSQNRRRRFGNSILFREIFYEIVRQCIDRGLVDGEHTVCDGSFLLQRFRKVAA